MRWLFGLCIRKQFITSARFLPFARCMTDLDPRSQIALAGFMSAVMAMVLLFMQRLLPASIGAWAGMGHRRATTCSCCPAVLFDCRSHP